MVGRVLRNNHDAGTQVGEPDACDIHAINHNLAVSPLDEAKEGKRERALPAPGGPDDADFLVRRNAKRKAAQGIREAGSVTDVGVIGVKGAVCEPRRKGRQVNAGGRLLSDFTEHFEAPDSDEALLKGHFAQPRGASSKRKDGSHACDRLAKDGLQWRAGDRLGPPHPPRRFTNMKANRKQIPSKQTTATRKRYRPIQVMVMSVRTVLNEY